MLKLEHSKRVHGAAGGVDAHKHARDATHAAQQKVKIELFGNESTRSTNAFHFN